MAACKSAKVRDIQTGPNLDLVLNTLTWDLTSETWGLRMKELLGQHAVLTLPEIQLEFKTHNAGIGLDIAETEVGVVTVLDLGDSALTTPQLGSHLRLGESGGRPGDDELIDEPGLGRELADGFGDPTIAMSTKHLVDIAIGTPSWS
jgi:hypothetical protein